MPDSDPTAPSFGGLLPPPVPSDADHVELIDIGIKDQWGACYSYWDIKKRILKYDYGIEWKSPKEMNPRIVFD